MTGAPPPPADGTSGNTAAPSTGGGLEPVEAIAPPIDAGMPVSGPPSSVQLDAVSMIGPKGSLDSLCRAWEQSCPVRPRYDRPSLCSCKPERVKAIGKPVAPVLDAAFVETARPLETGRYHIVLRPALRTSAGWFMAADGADVVPEEQGRYVRPTEIEHQEWVIFRFQGGSAAMIADRHGAMICSIGPSATPSCLDPIFAASPPTLMADGQGRLLVGPRGAVTAQPSGHPERHAERSLGRVHPVRFP